MAVEQMVKYFKVTGSRLINDDTVMIWARQVADYTGADLPAGQIPVEEQVMQPLAKDQPRGTIVKVTYFSGKTILVNPQS